MLTIVVSLEEVEGRALSQVYYSPEEKEMDLKAESFFQGSLAGKIQGRRRKRGGLVMLILGRTSNQMQTVLFQIMKSIMKHV